MLAVDVMKRRPTGNAMCRQAADLTQHTGEGKGEERRGEEKRKLKNATNPLTMHEIGFPTYCVAVMIRLQVSKRTVVKTLCRRKTALSV